MGIKTFLLSIVICLSITAQLLMIPNYAKAEGMALPETFTKKVKLQPAITQVIIQDDIKLALREINQMHSSMAEKGWFLYSVIEFIDDEDFEGFFVTYVRDKK